MKSTQLNSQPIQDILSKAKDIFIVLGQNPSGDTIASGIALYQSLNTPDKNVFIASPTQINQDSINIPDVDQITNKIGNRNLVISLKVESRESIDKVSYNLDEAGKVFNLVIQPKKGHPPLKSNDIDYSYAGVQADVVIVLGANRLEDLGHFYQNEPKLFTEATTISISRNPAAKFAAYPFTASSAGSLAEVTSQFIQSTGSRTNRAVSTSLIYGIDQATNFLQNQNVTATTFDTLAALMRSGGKRLNLPQSSNQSQQPPAANLAPINNNSNGSSVPQEWLSPKIYSGSAAKKS